jgi:hypothetical protein
MDAVDGNAIGGLLIDVFGTEMTAANSILRDLRRQQASGGTRRLPAGSRHRGPVPDLPPAAPHTPGFTTRSEADHVHRLLVCTPRSVRASRPATSGTDQGAGRVLV